MAGRSESAASTRAQGRPRRLPDAVVVKCPAGTRDRIEVAAEHDGMTPADWLRRLVRHGLDAARKRQARKAGGE